MLCPALILFAQKNYPLGLCDAVPHTLASLNLLCPGVHAAGAVLSRLLNSRSHAERHSSTARQHDRPARCAALAEYLC